MPPKSIKPYLTKRNTMFASLTLVMLLLLPIIVVISSQQQNLKSNAAGVAAIEPENGTISGNVTVGNDPNASGGKYIQFGNVLGNTVGYYGIAAGDVLTNISDTELVSYFDDIKSMGVQWIRFDYSWAYVQWDSASTYNWSRLDKITDLANARGIKILGTLSYVPPWALPAGCTNSWGCPPRNTAEFVTFVTTTVSRYAPKGVHHWEIWNEPNLGAMSAAQYTPLLKGAYPAIKNIDPSAIILGGSLAPAATGGNTYSPADFLTGMYANGGKAYFDALAHHPYCWGGGPTFNCPSTYADWSAWSQMQDTHPSLRSVMVANGDQNKKIWATEFGAPTGGGSVATLETRQAQVVTEAYKLWKSYSWSGPMFWYQYKDKCSTTNNTECYFGLIRYNGAHKPSYDTYKTSVTAP